MKRNFLNTLGNCVGTFSNGDHKDLQSDKLLALVDKSQKSGFPIYSLLVIISVTVNTNKDQKKIHKDGWIDKSIENVIIGLYAEIDRLKKIKLIDFPNIDKKWRIAFLSTLAATVIITGFLIFRTNYYVDKTEVLNQEKTKITEENIELEDKVDKYSDATKRQERKLGNLNTDYSTANKKIDDLSDNLSVKIDEITLLQKEIRKIKKQYNVQVKKTKDITVYNESLIDDNEFLKRKTKILEEKIRKINNVKFNLGISYVPNKKCNGKYNQDSKLYFDTYHRVLIRDIIVIAKKDGYCNFYVKDNNTREIKRKKVYLKKGKQTIELNLEVSKGSNHYLGSYGAKLLSLKKCYSFPYVVSNLIKLRKDNNNNYPSYFNWIVSANI